MRWKEILISETSFCLAVYAKSASFLFQLTSQVSFASIARIFCNLVFSYFQGLLLKALNNITKLSVACRGPLYTHVFPDKTTVSDATPKLDENYETAQPKESVKNSSPKKKLKRRISSNLSTRSSNVEQFFFPWDVCCFESKVNQSLPWPVGSFSLAFWLYLDGGRQHVERDHRTRSTRGKVSRECQKDHGKDTDGVDNIVHVISFGNKTAWFEVWVNFCTANLICRYGRDCKHVT